MKNKDDLQKLLKVLESRTLKRLIAFSESEGWYDEDRTGAIMDILKHIVRSENSKARRLLKPYGITFNSKDDKINKYLGR